MTARRKSTPEFKAKVALEARRGDRTIQEIAARHQVFPIRSARGSARRFANCAARAFMSAATVSGA